MLSCPSCPSFSSLLSSDRESPEQYHHPIQRRVIHSHMNYRTARTMENYGSVRNDVTTMSRKRQWRPSIGTNCALVMTALSAFCCLAGTNAYVPSSLATLKPSPLFAVTPKTLFNFQRASNQSTDTDGNGWLSWMVNGQRARSRGAEDVIMREAEELGGVARSDRYSSR
jgi:hypothetical protein